MGNYIIIDEPARSRLNYLILSPVAILFASVIVPLLIALPYFGRIWLPALLFCINGLLLGSATRWREIAFSLLGVGLWFGVVFGGLFAVANTQGNAFMELVIPYLRILTQALFFFCLIYVSSLQANAYAIYQYINQEPRA